MKKLFALSLLFVITFCSFAQNPYYTIYSINGSRKQTIEVGRNRVKKGYGDTIPENDCRIWWKEGDPTQCIEVAYSIDGKTYTFSSEKYVKSSGEWKEQYAYLKYLRTTATAAKGTVDIYYAEKPAFMSHGVIMIDGLNDNRTKYILMYCDKDYNVIEIEPVKHEGNAIFFNQKQFDMHNINLSDSNLHFTLCDNKNRTIINHLTIIEIEQK